MTTPRPAFAPHQRPLTLYYRALAGLAAELVVYEEAPDWCSPDTRRSVRLPITAPALDGCSDLDWYRVALTHRAMHRLLGTFSLGLDRVEPLFPRLRPPVDPPRPGLEVFARAFRHPVVAIEIFAVLEDLRVDAVAVRRFPGLAASYAAVRKDALQGRPELSTLPPRRALAEALVQFSLGAHSVMAPRALDEPLSSVIATARRLYDPAATVESSAEAAIRVYDVLAGLPDTGAIRAVRRVAFDDVGTGVDKVADTRVRGESNPAGERTASLRIHPVRYRDEPGARYVGNEKAELSLQGAMAQLLSAADAPEPGASDSDSAQHPEMPRAQRAADRVVTEPPTAQLHPPPPDSQPTVADEGEGAGGPLSTSGQREFVYPEWDHVAQRYLSSWCRVREITPGVDRPRRRRREALARYGHLVPGLVAQLERVRPVGRDLEVRMPYGGDLDLDACTDALVDLRAGVQPPDRVYTTMRERRRDVVVAFALDLSASTAERLPPRPTGHREGQRILDLQVDAVTLLTAALNRVGDTYGIYGFSGGGRGDVRVSVVKGVEQQLTPSVGDRLDGLAPDHTTRMAPVIRHLTARLERQDAATRLLIIVSDGRPYDVDYGQQYGESAIVDYAIADTAQAMAEARARGVQPYLITVDAAGGDYLGRMCGDREYHVIDDARDLPTALSQLYAIARGRPADHRQVSFQREGSRYR